MWERWFRFQQHGTTLRTEVLAGVTTFLTMSYIVFVQPAVMSGEIIGVESGIDSGAALVATCLASALATAIMALYARYPIALAPGMGLNFFFLVTIIPAAAAAKFESPWRVALGIVFVSGVLFLILSLTPLRERIIEIISHDLKNAIAAGIGIFIAFIGLQKAGIILPNPGTLVKLNTSFGSPDMMVFAMGLFTAAVLQARRIPGAILWGILAATVLAVIWRGVATLNPDSALISESMLMKFTLAEGVFALPPSLGPTFFQLDVSAALSVSMMPFVIILLYMDVFDTTGTLIGVGQEAGLLKGGKLERGRRAFLADAIGTVGGSLLGTSPVTSYIESASGIEQGGRTGLTGLTVALLFLAALFFSPVIQMVGSYPPITAPALVIVGTLMIRSV
ncbi:MAG: NCS2 family permease, partial [Planctomycetota bacterium]